MRVAGWTRVSLMSTMQVRAVSLVFLSALSAVLFTAPVRAASADAAAPDPLQFLTAIQQANTELDYSGVVTYTQEGSTQSMRLVHLVDGMCERERLELLDGQPREFLRTNDQVQCLIPEREIVLVERKRANRFPSLLLGEPTRLLDYYSINQLEQQRRVAGRECVMYELQPKDELRYGYRLCADAENALLLQAQTLDHDGSVIQQVAFASIVFGNRVQAADLESSIDYSNWRTIEATMSDVDLAAQGWRIPYPDGFEVVSQVSRSMGTGRKVSQLVLSDGLAALSVFIEEVSDQGARLTENKGSKRGSMNLFRTRIGDFWLTTTGEVPLSTLAELGRRAEFVPLAKKY